MATVLAALSGVAFAAVFWFVLTRMFALESSFAASIASILAAIEFFAIRYVLSKNFSTAGDDE